MVKKVAFDAGHGRYTAGKRTPAGEREWTFNDVVVRAAIAEMNNYEGVQVIRTDDPTGNTDVPLSTRAVRANNFGADAFVSVHHNANTGRWGTWTGSETYVMTPASSNPASMRLAQAVHPRYVKAFGLRDRGIKAANFAVLRETKMAAILTEGGYMDSTIDIVAMRNQAKLRAQGVAIAQGVAAFLGLKRKASTPAPKPTTPVSNKNLYRVRRTWTDVGSQKGAYEDLNAAKVLADKIPTHNVYDNAGKLVYSPAKAKEDKAVSEQKRKDEADLKRAIELGITNGERLNEPATRRQVILMIMRALKK